MTNEERWNMFVNELRAYIVEHHHCPNKHCTLYNAQKYYRRKMREGKLDEAKAKVLQEILSARDFSEHTGGRKRRDVNSDLNTNNNGQSN